MDQLIACVTSRIILQLKELVFSVRGTGLISLPSRADFLFARPLMNFSSAT